MKYLISLLLILNFCSSKKPVSLSYTDLPSEVKELFHEITTDNRTNFIPCKNTKAGCLCDVNSYSMTFIGSTISFESCGKKIKIPFSSTYLRIFVIDKDFLYYPDYQTVISFKEEEPISNFIKIDTLKFKKIKLKKVQ